MALLVHCEGRDCQDDGFSMALPDFLCCFLICGQMHILSVLREQSLRLDTFEEAGRRSVVEKIWRLSWFKPEIDRDRMSLVRADRQAIGGNGETFLVTYGDDFMQQGRGEWNIGFCDQLFDICPAFGVEGEFDGIRFVAQDVAKELACIVEGLGHGVILETDV